MSILQKITHCLKFIRDEFIYGGHLLSLGTVGLIVSITILLEKKIEWQILALAYLTPQIIYTYNHLKEIEKDRLGNPERVRHLQKIIKYSPLIISFYLLSLFLCSFFFTNLETFFFVFFLTAGGILFSEFFKGVTKKILGFKNFYSSLFWAAGMFLPLFYYSSSPNLALFLLFSVFVFLRFLADTIFFDIKDMESDKNQGLKTFPVIYGIKTTLKYLNLLNFFSFLPLAIGIYLKIFPIFSVSLTLIYFYSFYCLKRTETADFKKLRTLSYIMVDGGYILWPIFLILGKMLVN